MKKSSIVKGSAKGFVLLSIFSFASVSLMAFQDPQAVMNLVGTELPNTDAFSSIRGVYGGVGLSISLLLVYLLRKNLPLALGFLGLVWGLYATSRIITIFAEGPLGDFGSQWLGIESVFCILASGLYFMNKRVSASQA